MQLSYILCSYLSFMESITLDGNINCNQMEVRLLQCCRTKKKQGEIFRKRSMDI